jgi:hypothetical protein
MDGFYLALGVTFVLPFLQWAVPTMPRILAYAGVAGGITVMLAEFLDPTMKPPFSVVILFLIGVLCIGGAAHLYFQSIRRQPAKVAETAPADKSRGPTLEATNHSTISARGATIPGDLPFQVGRADNNSLIEMSGANFTRNPDGSITVTPGSRDFQFPPPTGEFAKLSTPELRKRLALTATELQGVQKQFDQDFESALRAPDKSVNNVSDKYRPIFERYADLSFSLASAAMGKIGSLSSIPNEAMQGSILVYHRKFAGPKPAQDAANFLNFLSTKLSSR